MERGDCQKETGLPYLTKQILLVVQLFRFVFLQYYK